MKQWIMSAVSPLVAFRAYDAPPALRDLAREGATGPPRSGPRHALPTNQSRAPLDDQANLLVAAAPPPERTSAPAIARKDAPPRPLSQRCQEIPRPGKPESAPLATLNLTHTTAPRAMRAPREITMALAGIALAVVDPPG